jgi:hypothetical protein
VKQDEFQKVRAITVYWKEADAYKPAKLKFSASTFFIDGMEANYYPELSQINDDFVEAREFFAAKRIELAQKQLM